MYSMVRNNNYNTTFIYINKYDMIFKNKTKQLKAKG